MNSIAGIVHLDGAPVDHSALQAPMRAMSRPGSATPDIIVHAGAAFAAAPQTCLRDGRLVVADARVDARTELAVALGLASDECLERPDAELLLASYERWGRACPEHVVGDYAFVVWDAGARTLFAARDHMGARPLYYAAVGQRLVFGSEIAGVLAFEGVSAQIDEAEIARYLISVRPGYFDPEHTFFTAIRKLPFGHRLSADASGVRVERYWYPERVPSLSLGSHRDYAQRLNTLVRSALADRLRGVRHAGVHLSGGLDSSALAVLTKRAGRDRGMQVSAYSWSPSPDLRRGAEHDRIEAVARVEGLAPAYLPTSLAQAWRFDGDISVMPRIGTMAETPIGRRAAAGGVRVMISGWGGDEAASYPGRGIAAGYLRSGRLLSFLRYCRERSRGGSALASIRAAGSIAWREGCVPLLPNRMFQLQQQRGYDNGPGVVTDALLHRVGPVLRPPPPVDRTVPGGRANMLAAYYAGTSAARIESWARFRADFGLTYVYPLTDRRILEFIYAVPPEVHVRHGVTRALFRDAMVGVLPDAVRLAQAKVEDARLGWLAREPCEPERSMLLARIDAMRLPSPHPWVDVARLRDALRTTPSDKPLPVTVDHALAALTIWRNWVGRST